MPIRPFERSHVFGRMPQSHCQAQHSEQGWARPADRRALSPRGLQAYALLAAAHGAIDAYVCGQDWKPYEGSQTTGRTISRQAITAQVGAFNRE